MIPFFRSLTELMMITEPIYHLDQNTFNNKSYDSKEKYIKVISLDYPKHRKISLPNLPKVSIKKWKKSKEAVSKFFNELDYNNQIQSSYDLTLLSRQKNYDNHDAA